MRAAELKQRGVVLIEPPTEPSGPWPSVSIIIPARNSGESLSRVLDACLTQDYRGVWETIVIDNGSLDDTREIAAQRPRVKLLDEASYVASPYSARNRGIEVANGEVIALLDATCVPRSNWLTEGVGSVHRYGPCLVAGKVVFAFNQGVPVPGEIWDSVTNIQQEESVARGRAKTANLFVHLDVIKAQGLFREGVRSGEDVRWTGDATASGWPLYYEERAIVEKPARSGGGLLRKSARTGAGKAPLMRLPERLVKGGASLVVPPAPWRVYHLVEERASLPIGKAVLKKVWLVAWAVRVAHGLGMLFPSSFRHAD